MKKNLNAYSLFKLANTLNEWVELGKRTGKGEDCGKWERTYYYD